ncbi:MAG: hypothetical protein HKN13_07375, partial [Rhodothermales bacterium]|nr:hypothetical protein [Rhodothermales bacterium]
LYSYSGLSDTDSAYMDLVLSGVDDKRDFHRDLDNTLKGMLPAEVITAPQDADIQIAVWVNRINFVEIERELVSAEMYGTMILARTEEPGEQLYMEIFIAKSAAQNIDNLIAGDGQLLESAIDECLAEIAKLMSASLRRMLNQGVAGPTA